MRQTKFSKILAIFDHVANILIEEDLNSSWEEKLKEKTRIFCSNVTIKWQNAHRNFNNFKSKHSNWLQVETVFDHLDTDANTVLPRKSSTSGRPRLSYEEKSLRRLEIDQSELLSTIIKIVQNSSAADERRRTECLCSVSTWDDLQKELTKIGFNLSRSGLNHCLLPRRGNTSEEKKYVNTVPVKLLNPENSLRKKKDDGIFAKSFIDDMFEVCQLFRPKAVFFMSGDDKTRVPLSLTAASLQASLLMNMEYKVKPKDHDFVVAPQHELIPSVYGICEVNRNVSYSGDSLIHIRSGKHDTSNAFTHTFDVRELFETKLVRRKPIMLMETDGAQNEAPHFPKTLATAVDLFRLLDVDVFHGANATGLSAFNPIES